MRLTPSNPNPLDRIERNLIAAPVVEACIVYMRIL
jgi:hypothetical protein